MSEIEIKNKVQYLPTGKLKIHPSNPRLIKDRDFEILCQSIQENPDYFEARPILCRPDMVVFAGNMRLRAAREIGMKEVPVVVMDITEEKARELMIRDNVQSGQWDTEALAGMFEMEELTAWGMPDFVFAEAGESQSGGENAGVLEAKEDDYEIPETIKTDIVRGDLFEIGPHRLLCGDSTDISCVKVLMNGEKADMVFTDPPYGVNVKGGKSKGNTIAGDLTQTAIPFSFELCVAFTKEKARFYFCGGESNIGLYFKLCERWLAKMPKILIWVKNGFVMKPNGYHNQYELIFYIFKDGGGGMDHWYAGRTESEASDVWVVKRDAVSTYEHPTQKPIELPSRAIKNSSSVGDLIFEPFGGSGSTFSAAHQLNRKCYGMEIDEKYCQVIIDRMLRLDPTLEIKRNGRSYNSGTKQA